MDNIIQVHRRERLLSLDAIYGLADRLNELGIARRLVIEWLADILHGWLEKGGIILSGEGDVIEIYAGIADDAHGEDGSGIWISEQRRRVSNPPQRRPRQSMLLRLQLYDAAFRISMGRSILDDPILDHTRKGD
jgi:hypothetical protein